MVKQASLSHGVTAMLLEVIAALLGGCAAQPRGTPEPAPVPPAAAAVAIADPSSPLSPAQKASRRDSRELLQAGRYADLDARMNGFQQAYRSGAIDDLELLREFGAFARTDSALQDKLDAWVQEYPGSYAAHLARGIYYFRCGVVTRGTKIHRAYDCGTDPRHDRLS